VLPENTYQVFPTRLFSFATTDSILSVLDFNVSNFRASNSNNVGSEFRLLWNRFSTKPLFVACVRTTSVVSKLLVVLSLAPAFSPYGKLPVVTEIMASPIASNHFLRRPTFPEPFGSYLFLVVFCLGSPKSVFSCLSILDHNPEKPRNCEIK
jgi:hypothetical protein